VRQPAVDPEEDYYAVLGVPIDAGLDEIKRAHRELARRYHPDFGGGNTARFRQVQTAYEILQDPVLRRSYDRQRASRGLNQDAPIVCVSTLSRSQIPATETSQMVYLLLEISLQKNLPKTRQPLNLALVIDRSTSMRGARIDNVKLAARELVDSLQENDRLALVAFSDRAEVIAPSTRATDKRSLVSAISRLVPGGGTEIYRGLLAGMQEVRQYANKNSINHVILLTDGRTYGDEEAALAEAKLAGSAGIGISALGIGEDWNDLFLDALARHGNGICEYINAPSQLQYLLGEQIRGLGATVVRGLRLRIKPADYVKLQAAYRAAPNMENLGAVSGEFLTLGSLGEDSLAVLLELVINQSSPGERRLVRVEVEADVVAGDHPVSVHRDIFANFMTSRPKDETVSHRLLSLLSRLSIFRLQEQAWQMLDSGDRRQATHFLESTATRLFDMGYRDLGHAAMLEADRVSHGAMPTSEGRKKLRYGTRSLTIPSKSKF